MFTVCTSALCLVANMCNFETVAHSCGALQQCTLADPHLIEYEKYSVKPRKTMNIYSKHTTVQQSRFLG